MIWKNVYQEFLQNRRHGPFLVTSRARAEYYSTRAQVTIVYIIVSVLIVYINRPYSYINGGK